MVDPHRAGFAALAALAALCACAAPRPAAAPAPAAGGAEGPRAFDVSGHGRLLLDLPPGWSASEGERGEASAPAIRLRKRGSESTALLTPLWSPGGDEDAQGRADTARLFADLARRKALSGSVEGEIPLERLDGPGVQAFWFAATDRELAGREPGPGEWTHLLQGAAAVGPLVVVFSLLDQGPGAQRSELLELVRTARYAASRERDEAQGGLVPLRDVRTEPLRAALPGRTWALLVDLPGFRLAAPAGGIEGVLLLGVNPETGIVASVVLRDAGGAGDALACRDSALARIGALAAVSEVRRSGDAASAGAAYAVAELRGKAVRQRHAHVFLFRDGVCADVHLSKTEPDPEDPARLERILSTVRLGEDL